MLTASTRSTRWQVCCDLLPLLCCDLTIAVDIFLIEAGFSWGFIDLSNVRDTVLLMGVSTVKHREVCLLYFGDFLGKYTCVTVYFITFVVISVIFKHLYYDILVSESIIDCQFQVKQLSDVALVQICSLLYVQCNFSEGLCKGQQHLHIT